MKFGDSNSATVAHRAPSTALPRVVAALAASGTELIELRARERPTPRPQPELLNEATQTGVVGSDRLACIR